MVVVGRLGAQNYLVKGPAVSVMAMSLDSHVVDCGLSLGPGGLNSRRVRVCVPKIPRGERRRRDCGVAIPPGGVISCFLSFCLSLSGERTLPIAKKNLSREPAVSVMAMSLDSHILDRGSCPGPGGLKLMLDTCACVPKIPRGKQRRDCNVAIPPGG